MIQVARDALQSENDVEPDATELELQQAIDRIDSLSTQLRQQRQDNTDLAAQLNEWKKRAGEAELLHDNVSREYKAIVSCKEEEVDELRRGTWRSIFFHRAFSLWRATSLILPLASRRVGSCQTMGR